MSGKPIMGQRHSPEQNAVACAKLFAVAMLILCCIAWGLSFPVMQRGARALERSAASLDIHISEVALRGIFNGWRFTLAAILYCALTFSRQRRFNQADLLGGWWVGIFYGVGILFQILGLRWILPSVSGFLTSLAVLFTPFAQAVIFKRPVGRVTWGAVALAVGGMAVLMLPNELANAPTAEIVLPPIPYLGQMLTIAAAILFTGQIMAVDKYGAKADPARITAVMLAVTAIVNLAGGLALGGWKLHHADVARAIWQEGTLLWAMPVLVFICSLLALHLMNSFQPLIAPAAAGVIYCAEPVFSTTFSVAMGTETLTVVTGAGGMVILAAVLLVAGKQQAAENG